MPPTLSPFPLLLDGSAFFINHHRLHATVYRLLPPTTSFHCLLPASTAFTTAFATSRIYYRLPPPSATSRAHGP